MPISVSDALKDTSSPTESVPRPVPKEPTTLMDSANHAEVDVENAINQPVSNAPMDSLNKMESVFLDATTDSTLRTLNVSPVETMSLPARTK